MQARMIPAQRPRSGNIEAARERTKNPRNRPAARPTNACERPRKSSADSPDSTARRKGRNSVREARSCPSHSRTRSTSEGDAEGGDARSLWILPANVKIHSRPSRGGQPPHTDATRRQHPVYGWPRAWVEMRGGKEESSQTYDGGLFLVRSPTSPTKRSINDWVSE